MTPKEIRDARQLLGLSQDELGEMLGFESKRWRKEQIREIEHGEKPLIPVRVRLLQAYLDGYRPADWPLDEDDGGEAVVTRLGTPR